MNKAFEIFCSLPFLEDDDRGNLLIRWIPDIKLRRHLDTILKNNPDLGEAGFAKFLLDKLNQNLEQPLIKGHLISFLARFANECVWRIRQELQSFNRILTQIESLSKDLLQLAFESALQPALFLKNFDSNYHNNTLWYPALKKYIRTKFERIIYDKIRQIEGMTTFKRSDLGLASRSSEKRVIEALTFRGESEATLSAYLLAWKCFQELRKANKIDLNHPKPDSFKLIANRYNQLAAKNLDNYQPIDDQTLKLWLQQIGAAIRSYLDRRNDSLDEFRYDSDSDQTTLDTIADQKSLLNSLEILAEQEMAQELAKFKTFLDDILGQLESSQHCIPLLKHGLSLVQMQIQTELDKNQSTVSRQYQKFLTQLLTKIGEWAKNQQQITLNLDTLSNLKSYLQEHLDEYYPGSINRFFYEIWDLLAYDYQEVMILYYVRQLNYANIARELDIDQPEVISDLLNNGRELLQNSMVTKLESYLRLKFKSDGVVRDRIMILTEEKIINLVI